MYDRPTFGSLFAGIGGIDLGLERAGWECRFQVEWDPFCQRVLAKHWPDVPRYGDIHDVHGPLAHADSTPRYPEGPASQTLLGPATFERLGRRGSGWDCPECLPRVDLLAGGFPCQPFSVAGRQRGMEDDRWLWPEFARAIRELRPRYVLVENVPGLLVGGGMGAVLGDLAELGFDASWESIPAAAVGAPHLRYRVWIMAYDARFGRRRSRERTVDGGPSGRGIVGLGEDAQPFSLAHAIGQRGRGRDDYREHATDADPPGEGVGPAGYGKWWAVEPDVGRVAHGLPARVDRLRALGNAVVPQVVEWIGRQILEAEALDMPSASARMRA